MRNLYRKSREYIPLFSFIIFVISIISLILYIIVLNSVEFADFFNYYLTTPIRLALAGISSIVPFSISETLLFASPIWITLLFARGIKNAKISNKATIRFLMKVLSILLFIFITFVWTYSSGFHNSTIDKKLGLETEKLSKDDLYNASIVITKNLNDLSNEILYDNTGASVMPYNYYQLSDKIYDAYELYEEEYGAIINFRSIIKPIILSEPMTYTHISGIYTFFTGESNVNVNYPDFIVASSSAHEMAHQRGVARENEANFTSFVVLSSSEDDFLRYSAYLNIYSDITSALYSADKELYYEVYSLLDNKVKDDLKSYSSFFDKYRDSIASDVTENINDSYLQANGQKDGVKSYGMIVDLTCAYLKSKKWTKISITE